MHDRWTIDGAGGEPILGDAHVPDHPRGVILIVHGFLGYKDYGMFPFIAESFADAGFIAHRFNLSHSGMTNDTDTFARPDLFERDTWNTQVHDIEVVMHAVADGTLAGQGLPLTLFGHSRGGVSVLLTAGRRGRDGTAMPACVITLAAPDSCDRVSEETRSSLRTRGYHEIVSNRTGQTLHVGADWLQEQLDQPDAHDLLSLCAHITCPVLVMHGNDDPTVPHECADAIADACPQSQRRKIANANHVLNVSNPMQAPSEGLVKMVKEAVAFAKAHEQGGR